MEEDFILILRICNFLPSDIKQSSFLNFRDVKILLLCSKNIRQQIELRYEILFKNQYSNLKDFNLNNDYCYGTWLNLFRNFKEVLICDEILRLIDLNLTEDIIYIPAFPISKDEIRHPIV